VHTLYSRFNISNELFCGETIGLANYFSLQIDEGQEQSQTTRKISSVEFYAILLDSDTKTLNIGMKINKENILEILKNPTH